MLLIFALSVLIFSNYAVGQINSSKNSEILNITDQIKVSYELNKLNDCRIKLRTIEFETLKTKEEKTLYAEAYRQLALAFRSHRYIRPGFEIYQKYISLRENILTDEKNKQLTEVNQKQNALRTAIVSEIAIAENEKKALTTDKTTLASLKKNNFTYRIFFTLLLTLIFLYTLFRINKKLNEAKTLLERNRKQILDLNDSVTKGQMLVGGFHRLKSLNDTIFSEVSESVTHLFAVEKEIKSFKEAEQPLRTIRECITKIKQLSEISNGSINNILQKIPGPKI